MPLYFVLTSQVTSPQLEYEDLASITEKSDGYIATVHGVITSVSPMKGKPAKKYFDGNIADGKKSLRFVGFSQDKVKILEDYAASKQPVTLTNCCIKQARHGNRLEVIIGDYTDIYMSSKLFAVSEEVDKVEPEIKEINIGNLQDQPRFQKVSLSAKIIEVDEVVTLDDGRKVQNAVISDVTGRAKLSLWEESINLIQLNNCYKFNNLMVKTHDTVFTPRIGLVVEKIEEIDALPLLQSIKTTKNLSNAQVIAVTDFTSGNLCINCNKSILDSLKDLPTLGRCPKCLSTALKNHCKFQVSATLHVAADTFKFRLFGSGVILSAIAEKELKEITEVSLLTALPFNATYSPLTMTVTNVSRF